MARYHLDTTNFRLLIISTDDGQAVLLMFVTKIDKKLHRYDQIMKRCL